MNLKKSNLRYPIIILFFNSLFLIQIEAQDLDQIAPPQPEKEYNGSLIPSGDRIKSERSVTDLDLRLLDNEKEIQTGQEIYRKKEYLNKILRHTYYQRYLTPGWSKLLNPEAWKNRAIKQRYWKQLRNYISRNTQEIIVLKDNQVSQNLEESSEESMDAIAVVTTTDIAEPEKIIDRVSINKKTEDPVESKLTVASEDPGKATNLKNTEVSVRPKEKNETPGNVVQINTTHQEKETEANNEPASVQPKERQNARSIIKDRVSESRSFYDKRGNLPWPVNSGRVTDKFGYRSNAQARGLRSENFGIDMRCPAGSTIKAIHNGIVLMSVRQAPYDYIVTIKHGDYTSAYFFLDNSKVRPGDQVVKGQAIGILKDGFGESDFHFEIWENQDRINPELWLKKR